MDVSAWMPFWAGDYLKDTIDLSRSEHGTYLLTICAYWSSGESLPNSTFRRVCGKDFERVSQFYSLCDGRWYHKRIDEELAKARANRVAAKEKASMAAKARWGKT